MKRFASLLSLCVALPALGQGGSAAPHVFTGTADASAAVALDADRFVVGSDEDSLLRVYRRSAPGKPVEIIDISRFLQLTKKSPETDIEAAARIGDRIYWITSHGENISGKDRPNRHRFFATDIRTNGEPSL